MPTFILFKNGVKAGELVGADPGRLTVSFMSNVIEVYVSTSLSGPRQAGIMKKERLLYFYASFE